jgi:hypothetical protein
MRINKTHKSNQKQKKKKNQTQCINVKSKVIKIKPSVSMSFLEKLLELGKLLIWATAKCAPIGRDSDVYIKSWIHPCMTLNLPLLFKLNNH